MDTATNVIVVRASSAVGNFLAFEFFQDGLPTGVESAELSCFGDGGKVLLAFPASDELDTGRVEVWEAFPTGKFVDVGNVLVGSIGFLFLFGVSYQRDGRW